MAVRKDYRPLNSKVETVQSKCGEGRVLTVPQGSVLQYLCSLHVEPLTLAKFYKSYSNTIKTVESVLT